MGLIKAEFAPTARLSQFSLADIQREAQSMLRRAQAQADQILAAAQQAGQALRQQAQAEGAKSGYADGLERGIAEGTRLGQEKALAEQREQLTTLIGALTTAATDLNTSRMELEAGVLREVTDLAIQIAQRITKRIAQFDPHVLLANVTESLKLVVGMHKLRIALHPTQKATLADALPRLKLEFPTLDHVELIADDAIAPGGCMLLTRQGSIDATLDEQLTRIAVELLPGDPQIADPACHPERSEGSARPEAGPSLRSG
jgi:flagellar assembly protein FliH